MSQFRFLRQPAIAVAAGVLALTLLVALFAPLLATSEAGRRVGPVFGSPSSAHPLGLDDAGQDVLSLLLRGARTVLIVGAAASLVAVLIGCAVGVLAGYAGGWVDSVLMRVTDYFLVVPALPFMIVVAAIWGPSLSHIILVIGLLSWTQMARLTRAQTMSLRERGYILRARGLGSSHLRIVTRHLLPHLTPLVVANAALTVATAIFAEAALAFLGLGDPTSVSWGRMIEHAFSRSALSAGAWWAFVPPGLCIAAVVVACSVIGQGVAEIANPQLQHDHLPPRRVRLRATAAGGGEDDSGGSDSGRRLRRRTAATAMEES
ncbi:ABC transporter permease [Microtetraspora fusca]|uniref:ABC transporter permease n=1 Tax=Microtetraspora fusca TaxID=1997 RepID=A0ABW6VB86_MICFU